MKACEAIAAAIELSGLSRAQVADAMGLPRPAVSHYANGARPSPSVDTIARFAEATGCLIVPSATSGDGHADCWVVRRDKVRQPKSARR